MFLLAHINGSMSAPAVSCILTISSKSSYLTYMLGLARALLSHLSLFFASDDPIHLSVLRLGNPINHALTSLLYPNLRGLYSKVYWWTRMSMLVVTLLTSSFPHYTLKQPTFTESKGTLGEPSILCH